MSLPSASNLIIGIDPGFTGAVALIGGVPSARAVVGVFDMPVMKRIGGDKTYVDGEKLAELLRPYAALARFAVVESVHAAPKQGVVSTFSFGQGYGTVIGVLAALAIPVRHVSPSVWKLALNVSSSKKDSINLARSKFPESEKHFRLAKDHGKAESVLLAWYGERLAGFQSGSSDLSDLL